MIERLPGLLLLPDLFGRVEAGYQDEPVHHV